MPPEATGDSKARNASEILATWTKPKLLSATPYDRPQMIALAEVEDADAHRGVQFVARKGQEIRLQRRYINRNLPDSLSGIGVETDSSAATQRSESFNGLRTSILLSSVDSAPQVVLVSSSGPNEGKTICSANLAVTMAHSSMTASSDADGLEEENSRVLLMDCDMRRPRLHQLFEVRRGAGISNILVGKGELQHSIVHTPIPNLDIIPCGPIPPNPSEILGSRKMRDLIAELRKVYTRIVIDSPPVMAVTDTMVLAPLADGIVYVVRAGDTPRQVAQNGVRQLTSINASILGAVLNCVGNGKDGYYDYQYYYYYGDDEEGG